LAIKALDKREVNVGKEKVKGVIRPIGWIEESQSSPAKVQNKRQRPKAKRNDYLNETGPAP